MMDQEKITIRKGGADDVKTIVNLNAALFREDGGQRDPGINVNWPIEHGESYFRPLLADDSYLCLLAELGGDVVGYLFGYSKDFGEIRLGRSAELESMYVRAAYRGQGVGGELAHRFLRWAGDQGAERVTVRAYASNERAISFYRRLGFFPYSLALAVDLSCVDLHLDLEGNSQEI